MSYSITTQRVVAHVQQEIDETGEEGMYAEYVPTWPLLGAINEGAVKVNDYGWVTLTN